MKKLFFALSLFATSLSFADAPAQSTNSTEQNELAYRGAGVRAREGYGRVGYEAEDDMYDRNIDDWAGPGRGPFQARPVR
jgi:hypothetical protein